MEDSLLISFDSNGIDEPCLVVMRKRLDDSIEVINFLYGKKAIDIYNMLFYTLDIELNSFRTTTTDGKVHVHCNVDFKPGERYFDIYKRLISNNGGI